MRRRRRESGRVVDERRVARVEGLGLLEAHDDLEEGGGPGRRRRRPEEEAARRLEDGARDVDRVMREVVDARLEAREREMRRRDAELDELADEFDVPDLGLEVVLRLLALEPAELGPELGAQLRADVLERLCPRTPFNFAST